MRERGNRMDKMWDRMRIKGIILMMMIVMVCNSGGVGEAEQGKNKFLQSLVNVSEEFLNVFTSFGEMVGSVLGLKADSKKSDVAAYFKTVQDTVQGAKDGLNKIVAEMKKESNPHAAATETAVNKLVSETLDKIITGAKTASEAIGGDANDFIGNVAAGGANGAGAGAKGDGVENLVKGIKSIVDIVLKNKGSAEAGDGKKADALGARGNNAGDAGKLFGNTDNNGAIAADAKKAAADAAKAVGAVTGADILQAISKNNGDSAKLANHNASAQVTGVASDIKDAVIAGGIALRAMAKGGKFANEKDNANNDVVTAVRGAAVSAVSKALDTLTIAIREAMDLGLKEIKKVMKINNDTPVATSEKSGSGVKNQ
ncbi:vlp protein, gamma subfamily (plasmid) [Borrelia duttonii Ly]|uniref:Variable large protein n=2 Tax=Borrelia duttonii TaxID=40834 RepID=B5RP29_BORDL|nr:vlp protein, gamma subfamily [Borrelia duttonii Ly]